MKLSEIKAVLRNGSYAWPGGYPMFFIMGDGETMHVECVKARWRDVAWAHINNQFHNRDFLCDAADVNWEDGDMTCCECNKRIESAYAEND